MNIGDQVRMRKLEEENRLLKWSLAGIATGYLLVTGFWFVWWLWWEKRFVLNNMTKKEFEKLENECALCGERTNGGPCDDCREFMDRAWDPLCDRKEVTKMIPYYRWKLRLWFFEIQWKNKGLWKLKIELMNRKTYVGKREFNFLRYR